jgi:hypothetical protein
MLKGTMKIEMTDVHTGETETVLEHNMVTDALTEIFRPLGLAKSPAKLLNSFAPYYQNLLGGLLLFDNPIEEKTSNIFAPSDANLVGCASYGVQNNTTGTLRGGYNQTESEYNITDRYMKYVYDFATSQANGTIACVCLTHKNAGFTSYGGKDAVMNSSYVLGQQVCDGQLHYVYTNCTGANTGDRFSGYTIGTTELLFLISREDDCCYYLRIDSASKLTIVRRRAYLKSVSVLENPYNKKFLIDEQTIELTTPLLAGTNTGYTSYYFDIEDNCLYLISSSASYISVNGTFQITKIRMDGWKVTQYTMTNTSDTNLNTSGMRYAIVHRGYLFIRGNGSPYNLYMMEVGNSANIKKFKMVGISSVSGNFCFAINGRIYFEVNTTNSGYYVMSIANMDTAEIMKAEVSRIMCGSYAPSYTPVLNEPLLWYGSYGNTSTMGYFILLHYLATINNLSEPVTKTADKTMKVTYIIQEQ